MGARRCIGWTAGVVVLLAAALGACGSSADGPDALTVEGAWARSTPPTAVDGVVYLQVESPVDDELLGAEVPASVAERVELHESMAEGGDDGGSGHEGHGAGSGGGTMTMVPLESVEIPAGTAVVFEPGSKHIMLVGLAAPLESGDHFPLTLEFAGGAAQEVDVVVSANAP